MSDLDIMVQELVDALDAGDLDTNPDNIAAICKNIRAVFGEAPAEMAIKEALRRHMGEVIPA